MKLDLLTNATVVDDAIRFVTEKSSSHLKNNNSSNNQGRERRKVLTIMFSNCGCHCIIKHEQKIIMQLTIKPPSE